MRTTPITIGRRGEVLEEFSLFFRGILSARTWFVAVRKFGVTRDLWTLDRLMGLTGSFWHQFQLYRHFTNANFKYGADKCGLKSTLRRFKTGTSKPDFKN